MEYLSNHLVSVLVRSRNRLPHVVEIIDVCLRQNYNNFEIVIMDQSDDPHWKKHISSVEIKSPDKVRIIRSKPLGSAGARNLGASHCKGDVILFIDDDNLPVGDDWISNHVRNYSDPLCIGVSGRYIHSLNESNRYKNKQRAYDYCLTYSFF